MQDQASGAADSGKDAGSGPVPELPEPVPDAVQTTVNNAINGAINGLEVAARMAGDVVRSVVPQSVTDNIPFLMQHVGDLVGVIG